MTKREYAYHLFKGLAKRLDRLERRLKLFEQPSNIITMDYVLPISSIMSGGNVVVYDPSKPIDAEELRKLMLFWDNHYTQATIPAAQKERKDMIHHWAETHKEQISAIVNRKQE